METTPHVTKALKFTTGEVKRALDAYDVGTAIRKLVYSRLEFYEKAAIIGFKNVVLHPIKKQDSLNTITLEVEVLIRKNKFSVDVCFDSPW